MPGYIDPETMNADELPGIWAPVQWDLTPEERAAEIEIQAAASLLSTVDVPEAILRLLLNETNIGRAYNPPAGYDPEIQGEWDPEILTFAYTKRMELERIERFPDRLALIYKFENLGTWAFEITPEKVVIERI